MRNTLTVARGAFVLAAAAVLYTEDAEAQTACDLGSVFANAVYVSGSSAVQPFVAALGTILSNTTPKLPISILYQSPEACLALNDLLSVQASTEVPVADPPVVPHPPLFYGYSPWPGDGVTPTPAPGDPCRSPPSPPPIDIAVSDVFYDTCAADGAIAPLTSGQKEILGPIEAMTFAAPLLSTATAISAEAAYVVFGYGAANYIVEPWNQASNIFVRPSNSGVEAMIGAAFGLETSLWQNTQPPGAGALTCTPGEDATDGCIPAQQQALTALMQSTLANVSYNQTETIGVLSAQEVSQFNAQSNANKLKILAYQQAAQPCGYLPDSTVNAKDKLNVRQGRYAIWGPLHFFFNVDARGNPLPGDRDATKTGKIAAMTAILNYVIATGPNPGQSFPIQGPLDGTLGAAADGGAGPGVLPLPVGDDDKYVMALAEANASLVPWCAMQVVRTSEIGPEASYEPREPCTCFYSNTTGAALPDYCVACITSADCTAPYATCRLGYCEVQ